jgi:MoxR-like ATPase
MSEPAAVYDRIKTEVNEVLVGNEGVIKGLVITLLSDGHMLLEGVPGIAKTTVAESFARATGLDYSRIQMTPDILPADITGTEVYQRDSGDFRLQRGPIFANVVVVDEVNRATPKTQSALLEAMQERQVTIGRETLALPSPFVLVATQNPIEMEGVYELPEAQRDRFQFRYRMDLLDNEDERRVVDRFDDSPDLGPDDLRQVVSHEEIEAAQRTADEVHVTDVVKEYLIDLAAATRSSSEIEHGASTRATLMLLRGAKAHAAIDGRDYVIPDDVLALVEPALAHRLVLDTEAELSGRTSTDVLEDVVASVDPPEAEFDTAGEVAGESTSGRE